MSPHEEYILAYTLSPLSRGQVFGPWPLHITIVPWFIIPDGKIYEAAIAISEVVCRHDPVTLAGEARMQFGPQSVIVMQKPPEMQALHDSLLSLIQSKGWGIAKKQYTGSRFKPHITDRQHKITPDISVRLDNIAFVKAPIANPLKRQKTVVDILPLGGENA